METEFLSATIDYSPQLIDLSNQLNNLGSQLTELQTSLNVIGDLLFRYVHYFIFVFGLIGAIYVVYLTLKPLWFFVRRY